ncbi:MAG TPA: tetratricopeptide repeat protein [Deltaproteobacteria bacterium]|nr:tetratricopeptide repeat protein [Deltaproteobacteria bacterium]HOI05714.1 tetratricopeptide repeat protein [Deltaproteobacteria bacterium]
MRTARTINLILAAAFFLSLAGCAHVPPEKGESDPQKAQSPYLKFMLARNEENQGNWKEALELYAGIDDPYAVLAQARINFVINQTDKALELVDRLIKSQTHVDEALELRTRIYARKGDWNQAIKDTEVLIKSNPDNVQLLMFLANLKIIVSDFKDAEGILRGILGKEEDDSMILYTLSKACLGSKDFACARDSLRKVIDTNPKFGPAYLDLGRTYELSKEPKKAEETYKKFLELEPFSLEGLISLTDLYITSSRYKDAIEGLIKIKQLNNDAQIVRRLVLLQLQEGRFEDALSNLTEIKEMTVEDSYYLAVTYAKLERLEDALDAVSEVPITSRLGCETVMLRSSLLKDLGRAEEVIRELSSAWEYFWPKGTCMEVGYQLATELDTAGRRDEGLAVAVKLLEKNPKDPVALNLVGYVWADQGINLDKAGKMIRDALKARPDDPYILDSMAWVLHRQGKSKQAYEYMKKALKKLDNDPTIHEHAGDILMGMGMKKKALDHYLKSSSLSKDPRKELKDKIQELLK